MSDFDQCFSSFGGELIEDTEVKLSKGRQGLWAIVCSSSSPGDLDTHQSLRTTDFGD